MDGGSFRLMKRECRRREEGGVRDGRRYAVVALDRGLTVLQTLAAGETPLALHEIASRARIPKTTAFRLLATLEGRGFARRTREGAYRVGPRAMRLAQATGTAADLRRAAQPVLQRLHRLSEDTVNLAKWDEGQVVYIEVLPSPRPLRFVEAPGSLAPLHATALGKAIAAHLPEADVADLLRRAGMRRLTRRTITSLARFLRELGRVRQRGFAIDREEKDVGAACIAVPVFDAEGVTGAISLSGPASRMTGRRIGHLAPVLVDACATLSRQLGHRPARGLDRVADTAGRMADARASRNGA
jgi:DNA-binding IclR family transcriptional regulator